MTIFAAIQLYRGTFFFFSFCCVECVKFKVTWIELLRERLHELACNRKYGCLVLGSLGLAGGMCKVCIFLEAWILSNGKRQFGLFVVVSFLFVVVCTPTPPHILNVPIQFMCSSICNEGFVWFLYNKFRHKGGEEKTKWPKYGIASDGSHSNNNYSLLKMDVNISYSNESGYLCGSRQMKGFTPYRSVSIKIGEGANPENKEIKPFANGYKLRC